MSTKSSGSWNVCTLAAVTKVLFNLNVSSNACLEKISIVPKLKFLCVEFGRLKIFVVSADFGGYV